MPLTSTNEPGEVDAFGVRFTMEQRGERVRCHIFRAALDYLDDDVASSNGELLSRFEKSRGMFERLASNLYDAGHRTPWIDAVMMPG